MRRNLGSELLRLGTVLTVTGAVASLFPYAALEFHATPDNESRPAFVTFVKLGADAERNAIKVAKSSLRGEESRMQRLLADLFFGELPAEPVRPVLPLPGDLYSPSPAPVAFGVPIYHPSSAAVAPQQLPSPEKSVSPAAFSREELLKID